MNVTWSIKYLGVLLLSCPFMNLMHQTLDTTVWDADTIARSMACPTCNQETFNHWQVCIRMNAMLNLHPNYTSRERQCWFVAMLPLKFLVLPENYDGPFFDFHGLHTPQYRSFKLNNPTLPIKAKTLTLLSYGMTHFLWILRILFLKLFS